MTQNTQDNFHPASVAAAQNIARLRREHGWSRREVLLSLQREGIEMPSTSLRRIEAQEQRLRFDEAIALAHIFDVSLDDLSAGPDPVAQADRAANEINRRGRKAGGQLIGIRENLDDLISELRGHQQTARTQEVLAWLEDCSTRLSDIPENLCGGPSYEEDLAQQAAEQAELDEHQRYLAPPPELEQPTQSGTTSSRALYEPETAAEKYVELGVIGHGDAELFDGRPVSLRPEKFVQREADARLKKM